MNRPIHDAVAAPSGESGARARPMLSREAEAVYWMARYVERAETVARMLLVDSTLLVDVGDLAPALRERQWHAIHHIMRVPEPPPDDQPLGQRVTRGMALDPLNPNSLVSCVTRARENARAVRESISAEMWENVNTLHWSLLDGAGERFNESPDELFRRTMSDCLLFQGLTDQTLAHDQRWLFAQLGKFLERADLTCRILQVKSDIIRDAETTTELALRNLLWMATLRTCCAIEGFRRANAGEIDGQRVASFLILQADFPRSIRFSLHHAHAAIRGIRAETNPGAADPAERILGRLDAMLEYAEPTHVLLDGIGDLLHLILATTADAAVALHKAYYLR